MGYTFCCHFTAKQGNKRQRKPPVEGEGKSLFKTRSKSQYLGERARSKAPKTLTSHVPIHPQEELQDRPEKPGLMNCPTKLGK
jgi:hypothetical protein